MLAVFTMSLSCSVRTLSLREKVSVSVAIHERPRTVDTFKAVNVNLLEILIRLCYFLFLSFVIIVKSRFRFVFLTIIIC